MKHKADKKAEFISKLTELLGEYSASIAWGCSSCSDLHGVTGQYMAVIMDRETVVEIPGDWITAKDIKDYSK